MVKCRTAEREISGSMQFSVVVFFGGGGGVGGLLLFFGVFFCFVFPFSFLFYGSSIKRQKAKEYIVT